MLRSAEREGSPRSVVQDGAHEDMSVTSCERKHATSSIASLLHARELGSSRQAPSVDAQILRWSIRQWMRRPAQSSNYCEIETAKSTIALAISNDGELFASTHGDHSVKVFRCATWQLVCQLRGHERTPWTVKFHPHCRQLLASGSLDQTVRLWHVDSGCCLALQSFSYVVSCVSFHSTGQVMAVTAGKRISLWHWQADRERLRLARRRHGACFAGGGRSGGGGGDADLGNNGVSEGVERLLAEQSEAVRGRAEVSMLLTGEQPQRCVAFKRSASSEMLFVAETNAEAPPTLPSHLNAEAHSAPPFTVQLWMWRLPTDVAALLPSACTVGNAQLRVARSVMYSDAGFDVSACGRYLALCELDAQSGYYLCTYSLQTGSVGTALQAVALPNCPYITSVQFSPLTMAVLIGYGRCQTPAQATQESPRYAVLRCIAFRHDAAAEERQPAIVRPIDEHIPVTPSTSLHGEGAGAHRPSDAVEVEYFAVDSTDESNVALFHPHASSCAHLAFLYATKDGRIRCFKFEPHAR